MQDITKQIQESQEALEALKPSTGEIVWSVTTFDNDGNPGFTRAYRQMQLSFFGKQKFITMMNSYLDRFIKGEFGVTVGDLFGGASQMRERLKLPSEVNAESAERMVSDQQQMITAISKLVDILPGFQMNIILLALGVPDDDAPAVKATLEGPVYRGGLDDDQAFLILETFIRQNAKAIRDFFAERAPKLYRTAQAELSDPNQTSDGSENVVEASGGTPGSMPSPTSSPVTPVSA